MLVLQVEQAERSVAQLVSEERERQRSSEMREEFSRLAGTVQSVSQKITENNSQMKEIGEKISSLVISSRGGGEVTKFYYFRLRRRAGQAEL